jgi:hypothetical protein
VPDALAVDALAVEAEVVVGAPPVPALAEVPPAGPHPSPARTAMQSAERILSMVSTA